MKDQNDLDKLIQERKDVCAISKQKILPYVTFVGDLSKDSKVETVDIPIVDVGDDYEFNAEAVNIPEQPQIITVANNVDLLNELENSSGIQNLPEVHVILEDKSYKITSNSLIEAVDTCYKVIKLNNLSFPPECKNLWSFLTQLVYKTNDLLKYAKVAGLISELGKMIIEPETLNEVEE